MVLLQQLRPGCATNTILQKAANLVTSATLHMVSGNSTGLLLQLMTILVLWAQAQARFQCKGALVGEMSHLLQLLVLVPQQPLRSALMAPWQGPSLEREVSTLSKYAAKLG
uniref:Uncharacterized protein n=1 Tax=Opuntia streptacantha TaxID=393608 RepID=A0A7C9ASK5_OPUST